MLELDFVSRRDSKVHDRRKRVGTSKARRLRSEDRRSETPNRDWGDGDIIRMGYTGDIMDGIYIYLLSGDAIRMGILR